MSKQLIIQPMLNTLLQLIMCLREPGGCSILRLEWNPNKHSYYTCVWELSIVWRAAQMLLLPQESPGEWARNTNVNRRLKGEKRETTVNSSRIGGQVFLGHFPSGGEGFLTAPLAATLYSLITALISFSRCNLSIDFKTTRKEIWSFGGKTNIRWCFDEIQTVYVPEALRQNSKDGFISCLKFGQIILLIFWFHQQLGNSFSWSQEKWCL